jgi:DNA mismatch repair protein MutL
MSSIRVLPSEIVNRIAAGEVVERPASVLKELVENAIDASATEVFVELEEGGKKLILVRDNGSGMSPEDLPLAFESHATSKLSEDELSGNLLGVTTLGFRGEALASIQSVAMLEVISKPHGSEHANRFRPGTGANALEPAARETGTTIEVRNLFYNTPARRKFLRTNNTEFSHSVAQMTRLALGFPCVHLRLTHGGKVVLDLSATDTLDSRLRQLVGNEAMDALVKVEQAAPGPSSLSGFVSQPRLHRKDAQGQNFFVNGRWVRDRVLSHALRSAYQGFLIPGKQPVAYLFLELPPGAVDVNVHPTKTEVRFKDSQEIYRLVHHAVREALEARGTLAVGESPVGVATSRAVAPSDPGAGSSPSRVEQAALEFLASPVREKAAPFRGPSGRQTQAPSGRSEALYPSEAGPAETRPTSRQEGSDASPASQSLPQPPRAAYQVLDSYIVTDAPDGIIIIDQHAFHEKILFEKVFRILKETVVESQRLLLPEVVDVTAECMPLVEKASELLGKFGFELDAFGSAAVAIHAFPAVLDRETGRTDLGTIVRAVLESLRGEPQSAAEDPLHDPLYRIASMIACKRAVKAGMPLSEAEIQHLLECGDLAQDPRHCPHGRPTAIVLSHRDIERRFDRK